MQKKLLFIMNPVAGTKRLNRHLANIISMLSDAGYDCQIQTTTKESGAKKWVLEYGKEKDIIVCGGGDGTLNDVVSGCLQLGIKPKIGYIPCGSTNDFANGLNMSLHPIKAVKNIINNKAVDIDIGIINNRPFVYTASFGIFTKASYNAPREMKNSLGYFAYVLEGVKEIGDIKSYHLKLTTSTKNIEGDYIFGGICNSKQIGGGVIKFGDEVVNMNDGLFEVFLVKYPKNATEFMELMFDFNSGNYNSNMIELFSTDELKLETEDEIDWTVDGEHQKGSNNTIIKNNKSAISLIL